MKEDQIQACDYAVAFIDLLGQSDAMRTRHLPGNEEEALKLIKNSVGKVVGTQKLFQSFYDGFTAKETLYSQLSPELREQFPDLAPGELKWQRFSDGFVIYIPLGNGLVKSPASSIFGLLLAAGSHCLTGLAACSPLRVGIDVAWALEYKPGELCGAALAYAYELESKVAQWPRVVVGEGMVDYLRHYANTSSPTLSGQVRRRVAMSCLRLLRPDVDDVLIVDYLGSQYRSSVGETISLELVEKAKSFAVEQLAHWKQQGDAKLVSRYEQTVRYFNTT